MKRFLAQHFPMLILAAICLVFAGVSDAFRQADNLQQVTMRTAGTGVMAIGQLLVILGAGIDLSVGSVAALAGVLACVAMDRGGVPVPLSFMLGIGAGLVCGLINGLFSTKGRIPPFIVTLGMMMIARGATHLVCAGKSVFFSDAPDITIFGKTIPLFEALGGARAEYWWVPVSIAVAVTIICAIALNHSRFGRALYATGGNAAAARLSGVHTDLVRIASFAICGMLAGLSGVMIASRTGIGSPSAAETYELDAIAACVIGGASLMGGAGGAFPTLAGALLMMVLINFCNLQGFDPQWQKVLVGSLIVVLVYYDGMRKKRAGLLKE